MHMRFAVRFVAFVATAYALFRTMLFLRCYLIWDVHGLDLHMTAFSVHRWRQMCQIWVSLRVLFLFPSLSPLPGAPHPRFSCLSHAFLSCLPFPILESVCLHP